MIRAAVVAVFLASPALADLCIVPVEDGKAEVEPELSQPYRMASHVRIVPGYQRLIIAPTNRSGLHTIRDRRFEPLDVPFPRYGPWQYNDIFPTPDGRVIGFGRRPDVLYQVSPDGQRFDPIGGTDGYRRAFLDTQTGVLRFAMPDGRLFDLTLDGPIISTMTAPPGVGDINGALPRYVPAFRGHIAASDTVVWFLADGAATWTRLDDWGVPKRYYEIAWQEIVLNEREGLAHMMLGLDLLTFDVSGVVPRLLYRIEDVSSLVKAGGRVIVEPRKYARHWWGGIDRRKRVWPDLSMPGHDGPAPVPGMPETVDQTESAIQAYRLRRSDAHDLALVWINGGWWTFDGTALMPAPETLALGPYHREIQVGQDRIWSDGQTLLRWDGGLTTQAIPTPVPDGKRFELYQSDVFGGTFIGSDGQLWFTRDLVDFTPVRMAARVSRVLSDLPDAPAALALGADGLYLVEHCKGLDQ